jgi:putative oxidoreductase
MQGNTLAQSEVRRIEMGIYRLLLRATVGLLLIGHGTQKLFGWFGGGGIEGTAAMFDKLGLRPGRRNAIAAGGAEAAGGALLVAGLEMPLAAALGTGSMLTAIQRVHRANGIWVQKGGVEYPAVLIALLLALVEVGPGELSLDAAVGRRRRGSAWAALAFGAGSLGAYVVDQLARRSAGPPVDLSLAEEGSPERAAA